MPFLEVVVDDKDLKQYLGKFQSNIERMDSLFQRASNIMHADIIKHFNQDKKSSSGRPWAPLKKVWNYVKNDPSSLLVRSGRLRGSMAQSWGKDNAKVFTNVEYAAVHNFGFRGIPKREFMWIGEPAVDRIVTMFSREIIPK